MITQDPVKPFVLDKTKKIASCKVFTVLESELKAPEGEPQFEPVSVFTIDVPHWVNVAAVTSDGYVLLVEQHRFGPNALTLETPGGCMDPHEKDATMSALRELEEETGYTSQRLLGLPSFYPNPALHGNRIHFFLALDCQPLEKPVPHNDPMERIRVHKIHWNEACQMARSGRIQHALSSLCLCLAEPYVSPQAFLKNQQCHPGLAGSPQGG